MKCREIIQKIEEQFPPVYAEDWDNVGLLVGHGDMEVQKVMTALDATEEVTRQAVLAGAQLLVTHHPLIFQGMKRMTDGDFLGKKVLRLAENKIACYAMHTNFDVMGMAEALGELLGLQQQEILMEVSPFVPLGSTIKEKQGIGRVGLLPEEMTVEQCGAFVKDALKLPYVIASGDPERKVRRAAVSSGSGRSMIGHALEKGAQVLITGDIGHHEALDAMEQGLSIIDAGHYGTEKLFAGYMAGWFAKNLPGIACVEAEQRAPFFIA